jgi:hypothetical protein
MSLPQVERDAPAHEAPQRLLWSSFRALIPTLIFDVGGTMVVYYIMLGQFPKNSIWPLVGASLVPVISNVFNFIRHRSFDIVGIIVLVGLVAGIVPAILGGNQRMLLVRESFVTGAIGAVLLISGFLSKPLGYYIVREFLTANEALPHERWDVLWRHGYFRHGLRIFTIAWGALLLGEFVLRAFMALTLSVAFVLGVAPMLLTVLLLIAGVLSAIWLSHAIKVALAEDSGLRG